MQPPNSQRQQPLNKFALIKSKLMKLKENKLKLKDEMVKK
jgi:uncharacterized protein YdcH (DUF465 family)